MRRCLLVGDERIGWLAGEHIVPSTQYEPSNELDLNEG